MKKRRFALATFIVIACLTFAIGYAAISQNLTIGGSIQVAEPSGLTGVKFEGTPTIDGTEAAKTASSASVRTETTANISVLGLANPNDYVEVTFTVNNTSSYDVKLDVDSKAITGTNAECFEIETAVASADLDAETGTTTVTVRVTLKAHPAEALAGTISVVLKATGVTTVAN